MIARGHHSTASKFSAHEKRSQKHKNSITDFQLLKNRPNYIRRIRKKLSPIIKCIFYCGKTNQALKGHRDDSTQDSEQQGNFKELIEFRIESEDVN
jgi:hypothetical protein